LGFRGIIKPAMSTSANGKASQRIRLFCSPGGVLGDQSFVFEIRERICFGGFFAPSAESFTALPLSISISRLQTGQFLRAAKMISIREVIVMSVRQ
jgi:hypothetical protein